jgi:hypothetical protein
MNSKIARILAAMVLLFALLPMTAHAQQTLGAVDGTVTDSSGGVVQGVTVKVHNVNTGLEQTAITKDNGTFSIVDLPIGTYRMEFSKTGFKTDVHPEILVRGNTTSTVNASLQAGEVSTTVTVNATPLLNDTDTTNGYTLNTDVIESTPLGTGSFTQLAILAPGVSADLLSGSGTNAGLGNQSIWANGQRDTSNGIAFNGVNANNIFNGKTSSGNGANRAVLNTGEIFSIGGEIQTSTSVYDAIGQGLPTPPPETIQEMTVNAAMYDAAQGANSGAHVELVTKSGTNNLHGQVYEYHQTDGWNAAPFFRNALGSTFLKEQGQSAVPKLKRNTFGGLVGGPIKKDKLFFFASYQGLRASDQDSSFSGVYVPQGLGNFRDAATLANIANNDFFTSLTPNQVGPQAQTILCAPLTIAQCNAHMLPPGGKFLVPNEQLTDPFLVQSLGFNALVQGPATTLTADQVNGNIDYIFSEKDRVSGKYYYQHNPTSAPFGVSGLTGFPQQLSAGAQVASLTNTVILTPNLTWVQRAGFIRETVFANTQDGFKPSDFGFNIFGTPNFPGINIGTIYQDFTTFNFGGLSFGAASNFANAGTFQNQYELASDLTWVHGRHTISTGFQWDHNQLNIVNKNNEVARLGYPDFPGFLTGSLCSPTNSCPFGENSELLTGATNRYYRSNQTGAYAQDNIRLTPHLSVNVGIRWDWDGPLVEQNGLLTNFDPTKYQYTLATDTVNNIGLVVAGNNKAFGTPGVSNSTLTGRQWVFGPRIGVVWSPSFLKNFVMRAGWGLYADRGEFFTELSPSAGGGISGPFGVTTELPFVVPFFAPNGNNCAGPPFVATCNPFGTTPPPPPPNNLNGIIALVPNQAGLSGCTAPFNPTCTPTNFPATPFTFAGYDPRNKLPYSENWSLDLQWQPRNDLVMTLAYVGNHGLHELVPVPFNEAGIATPAHHINGEMYSYGYTVPGVAAENFSTLVSGFSSGNAALRVPFVGFDPNSQFNEAEGISHYNALQFSVTKRMSHGLQVNGSYTWSHTLDEGSGIGLFFNGNDPNNVRSAYGNSDFDRTHVLTISYLYQLPKMSRATGFLDKVVNGWGISGVTVLESGQPYSVIDFSGGVASIFYGGGNDAVTNPIVPIGGVGASSSQVVLQGTTGVNPGKPVLNANAFGVPLLPCIGTNGVPPPDPMTGTCDAFETGFGSSGRNLFRGSFQTRFDFSITKNFKLTERFSLKYDAQFFNLFNHPSFDTPNNNVLFNPSFRNPPFYGPPADGSNVQSCAPQNNMGGGAYLCPPGGQLGLIQHTIGSPRFIQMALHLTF